MFMCGLERSHHYSYDPESIKYYFLSLGRMGVLGCYTESESTTTR